MRAPTVHEATPPATGLSTADVAARRAEHGWNELREAARPSRLRVFARQFASLLILILVGATVLAFLIGETVDAIAIALVVALNGVLGFAQEWRAERAIEALRSMLAPQARVVRDERVQIVAARELAPGDLVLLEAGDRVPADLVPVTAASLRVDERVLTGESVPVEKSADDPEARLFMGTALRRGAPRAS